VERKARGSTAARLPKIGLLEAGGFGMDPVGVGLAMISVVLFGVSLGLSTRPAQVAPSNKKKLGAINDGNGENHQKTILVKLPQGNNIPEDYSIDLRVSLTKNKKEREEEKENKAGEQGRKISRRLDEFF
jgi:hypothetical protein